MVDFNLDWGKLNPVNSSLFTGAGTAWGPMQEGMPGAPAPKAQQDIGQYIQDWTPFKQMNTRNELAQGNTLMNQFGNRAAGMGAGQSAGARRGTADIMSNMQGNIANANTNADMANYQQAVQRGQFGDTLANNQYNAQMQAYPQMYKNFKDAQAQRRAVVSNYAPYSDILSQY